MLFVSHAVAQVVSDHAILSVFDVNSLSFCIKTVKDNHSKCAVIRVSLTKMLSFQTALHFLYCDIMLF